MKASQSGRLYHTFWFYLCYCSYQLQYWQSNPVIMEHLVTLTLTDSLLHLLHAHKPHPPPYKAPCGRWCHPGSSYGRAGWGPPQEDTAPEPGSPRMPCWPAGSSRRTSCNSCSTRYTWRPCFPPRPPPAPGRPGTARRRPRMSSPPAGRRGWRVPGRRGRSWRRFHGDLCHRGRRCRLLLKLSLRCRTRWPAATSPSRSQTIGWRWTAARPRRPRGPGGGAGPHPDPAAQGGGGSGWGRRPGSWAAWRSRGAPVWPGRTVCHRCQVDCRVARRSLHL